MLDNSPTKIDLFMFPTILEKASNYTDL